MRRFSLLAALVTLAALLFASSAEAQVHWDVGADTGVMKRVLTSRPSGGSDAGFGPIVGVHAHVALMPLLRIGAYLDGELSPTDEPTARRVYSGGLRLKLTPPVAPTEALRFWVFAGVGYAGVYSPAYHTDLVIRDANNNVTKHGIDASGAGGRFLEIPLGIGMGWRFRKPWELTFELSGRMGLFNGGTLYSADGRPATVTGGDSSPALDTRVTGPGQDSWAIGLTVGIGLDL